MTSLWLVRHGRPCMTPGQPAAGWPLADPGEPALLALRAVLPSRARWLSSPEPKAYATATVLRGGPVERCPDLAEQLRGDMWLSDGDFALAVQQALRRPDRSAVDGWEPASETRRRVSAAVDLQLAGGTGDLVLVGHGTAWTLLVAALTGTQPDLAAWASMRMPDLCVLTMGASGRSTAAVRTPWGAWSP